MTRQRSTLAYREINRALFKLTVKQTLSSGEKWPQPGALAHLAQTSGRMALAGYPAAALSWFCPQSYCDGERGSALRRMLPRAPAFTSAGEKWKLALMNDC